MDKEELQAIYEKKLEDAYTQGWLDGAYTQIISPSKAWPHQQKEGWLSYKRAILLHEKKDSQDVP